MKEDRGDGSSSRYRRIYYKPNSMKFEPGDIVKASATKSDVDQPSGLKLEDRGDDDGSSSRGRRIYVRKVGSIFKRLDVGDRLLQINGMDVSCNYKFPNGLIDIRTLIKREKHLWVKVLKGGDPESDDDGSDESDEVDSINAEEEEEEEDQTATTRTNSLPSTEQQHENETETNSNTVNSNLGKQMVKKKINIRKKNKKTAILTKMNDDNNNSAIGDDSTVTTRQESIDSIKPNSVMHHENVNGTNLNGQLLVSVKDVISTTYDNDNDHDNDTTNGSKNYPTSTRGRKSTSNNSNNYGTHVSPAPQQEERQQQLQNELKQRCDSNRDVVAAVETTSNDTKWSSTKILCLTNLIEPGDIMVLRYFWKKHRMNGTTIEVVKPSINRSATDRRWDVKVLNNNSSQSESCKQKNPIRMISVASSNLRHFV
jgi:hypothetical protein